MYFVAALNAYHPESIQVTSKKNSTFKDSRGVQKSNRSKPDTQSDCSFLKNE